MKEKKDSMPVVEQLAHKAKEERGELLKDMVVLHINHCMDNSLYFTEILNRLFYRAVFVGVPYNDGDVKGQWSFVSYYGKKRWDSYELWRDSRPIGNSQGEFMEAVERLIETAVEREIRPQMEKGKRLLIIEDGGYHYPVLNRFLDEHPELAPQVCGSVEQTASGTLRCIQSGQKRGYRYPCASISRSDIKMHIESRFIGHRVVEELAWFLYTANAFLDFHHVLLLGYGIVGRQVALDLEGKSCRLSVVDTDDRIAAVARRDGHQVVTDITAGLFDRETIIIGTTGAAAFTTDMLEMFFQGRSKRIYLASASSQDREFKVFLDMADGKNPWPSGAVLKGKEDREFFCCFSFDYRGEEKEVVVTAEGLPVNFYRKDGISLTYSVIDLIFAEMLSMGLAFHSRENQEKKLWLLGCCQDVECFLTEEELARLWFSSYGLTGQGKDWSFPKSHPEGDYLRKRMLEETVAKETD